MAETSVRHEAGMVECFRHGGDECRRCDGSGLRPRALCAGCGKPSGRPSEGGEALVGLRGRRGKDRPLYCGECHPERPGPGALAMLERLGA